MGDSMEHADAPRIVIEVPTSFSGLPIGGRALGGATARYRELSGELATQCGEHAGDVLSYLSALAGIADPRRLWLFGSFAAQDGARSVFATLALTVTRLVPLQAGVGVVRGTDRLAAANLLRDRYRHRHPYADASVVQLVSGPALVASSARENRLPPSVTGEAAVVVRHQVRSDFQIPAPDGLHLIVLSVSSDSEAGWPSVAASAMRVANSIRCMERPERRRTSEHALGGRDVRAG